MQGAEAELGHPVFRKLLAEGDLGCDPLEEGRAMGHVEASWA